MHFGSFLFNSNSHVSNVFLLFFFAVCVFHHKLQNCLITELICCLLVSSAQCKCEHMSVVCMLGVFAGHDFHCGKETKNQKETFAYLLLHRASHDETVFFSQLILEKRDEFLIYFAISFCYDFFFLSESCFFALANFYRFRPIPRQILFFNNLKSINLIYLTIFCFIFLINTTFPFGFLPLI